MVAIVTARKYHKIEEYETGAVAVAYVTTDAVAETGPCLKHFLLHLSAAGGAGTLTIKLKSRLGTAYDTILVSQDMTAVTDFVWIPEEDGGHQLFPGDKIQVDWANANLRTYGYTALYKVK